MSLWLIILIVYGVINLGITIWAFISIYDYLCFNGWQVALAAVIFMIFGLPITIYGLILKVIER